MGQKILRPARRVCSNGIKIRDPQSESIIMGQTFWDPQPGCVITKTRNLRPAKSEDKKLLGPATGLDNVIYEIDKKSLGPRAQKFWSWNRKLVV